MIKNDQREYFKTMHVFTKLTAYITTYAHTHTTYGNTRSKTSFKIEFEENEVQETTTQYYFTYESIAAVSIRAEVTAQADYVILYSGKTKLFVHRKIGHARSVML